MKVLFCFRILVQYLRFECLRDVILTLSVSFPLGALPLVQRSLYGLCCYAVEGESGPFVNGWMEIYLSAICEASSFK